jgi:hypothetical protein
MIRPVGYIHIPKCAGKAIHRALRSDDSFVNLGHRAAYPTKILCRHKTSPHATEQMWHPPDKVWNNEYLVKRYAMRPNRFTDRDWPYSTFDWANLSGFYEDAITKYGLYKQDNHKELEPSLFFSSIKNPFDQLRSYWRNAFPCGWMGVNVLYNIKDFEHFINLYCDDEIGWNLLEFKTNPFYQLYLQEDKPFVPKENLIRFENIKYDTERVAEIMGLKNIDTSKLDHTVDEKRNKVYREETRYTKNMVLKVRRKLHDVLNEFEYDY